MTTKIAINGFGRIGRPTFRRIIDNHPKLEVAAINDLTEPETLAHLLKYDSLYGKYDKEIRIEDDILIIEGKRMEPRRGEHPAPSRVSGIGARVKILAEKEPEKLPWKDLGIDIVLECTGFFTDYENARKHLEAGAKKVIISAPSDSLQVPTYLLGVNEEKYDPKKDDIISMASCTTNALAPVVKILHENFTIKQGFMTTAHSYTNTQRLLDLPHGNLREARAAAINIIPTVTGAAKTVAKTIPELKGKLDGIAWRVPTPTVSIVDFVCLVKKKTNVEQVNNLFKQAAEGKLKGILGVSEEPLVSMDFKGDSRSAIVDLPLTMVKDNLVKVGIWYDNEWGYACRLAEMTEFILHNI